MSAQPDQVVVTAVVARDRQVLMVHTRPELEWYPDAWDLPRGDAMPGEEPAVAITRVLAATVGIEATVTGDPVAHVRGEGFRKDIWLVEAWSGTPRVLAPGENDEVALVRIDELKRLRLADPRLLALVSYAVDGVE